MPCPHFSREDSGCRLWHAAGEEEVAPDGYELVDEPVNLALCLTQDTRYRQCGMFRRQIAEVFPGR